MKKYKIPVYAIATASECIGEVECDSYEEFLEKSKELWDEKEPYFPNYDCNPFDLGDIDMDDLKKEDMKYYKNSKQ